MCCNINEFLARADVCSPEALMELWQSFCLLLLILCWKWTLVCPWGEAGPEEVKFVEHSHFLPYNVLMCSVSFCHPPSPKCHQGPEGCSCQCLWQTILNKENENFVWAGPMLARTQMVYSSNTTFDTGRDVSASSCAAPTRCCCTTQFH